MIIPTDDTESVFSVRAGHENFFRLTRLSDQRLAGYEVLHESSGSVREIVFTSSPKRPRGEHVSPAKLMRSEISRRPGSARADEATLAQMRRWFFARKPDAGFVLTDFPATLLQAKVFDEWLDARDEALSAAIAGPGSPEPVVAHYRTLGLLFEAGGLVA